VIYVDPMFAAVFTVAVLLVGAVALIVVRRKP
jgi:hypothetical protein